MAGSACLLCAQKDPEPVFPKDGKVPSETDSRELLQAVCPGQVRLGESIGCGKTCPAFTAFHGDEEDWSVIGVTRGHFLSPTSDDALLSVDGCEPHMANFGGTILLTRQADGWRMQWYKDGVITSQCHKILLLNGRELLVCIDTGGFTGVFNTALYVEDLLRPAATLMAEDEAPFFSAPNTVLTCGYDPENQSKPDPVTRAFIERVEFTPDVPPAISVTASYGESVLTAAAAKACALSRDRSAAIVVPVTSYRLDFVFDGRDYKPTAASAKVASIFAAQ